MSFNIWNKIRLKFTLSYHINVKMYFSKWFFMFKQQCHHIDKDHIILSSLKLQYTSNNGVI